MKEELLKQISELGGLAKEGIIKTVEILQEQAPLVVQEIYRWQFSISLIRCLSGLAIIVCVGLSLKYYPKWIAYCKKNHDLQWPTLTYGSGDHAFCSVVWLLVLIPFSFGVMLCNVVWLKILVAPKLFLIEYVSQLIK